MSTDTERAAAQPWVCPWGICSHADAQACRATIGTTKLTRGCGNRFPPGMTPEQARAAIAQQPALTDEKCLPDGLRYKLPPLAMTGHQLRQALEFCCDDLDTELHVALRPGGTDTEGEKVEAGLCCWLAEYPEEGSILLDGRSLHDAPQGAAIAQPAEPAPWELTEGQVIELAVKHGLGRAMNPIGMQTGSVFRTEDAYRTGELLAFAADVAARTLAAQADAQPVAPMLLKGIGKINGDGWKDTTRIGDVVYAWNREMPEPYAPGQFPRLGHPIWSASTQQYDFRAVPNDELPSVVDQVIEELRTEVGKLKDALAAAPTARQPLTDAARDVLAERQRQISAEGWTPEHDDKHSLEEMAFAASCYCTADEGDAPPAVWPWDWKWWKPRDRRRNMVRAAALLLAEIERLDRAGGITQEGE